MRRMRYTSYAAERFPWGSLATLCVYLSTLTMIA